MIELLSTESLCAKFGRPGGSERRTRMTCIGPYRLVELLGEGGMGSVYRAQHLDTGQVAALKTVTTSAGGTVQSIRREIHALARLSHPDIVRVLDHGVHGGRPWYAMELLRGTPFREFLQHRSSEPRRRSEIGAFETPRTVEGHGRPSRYRSHGRPLPPEALGDVVTLFRRLCAPLRFLHGEGIVHRDLKPENVLIRKDGRPVLIDFGLASQFDGRLSLELVQSSPDMAGTLHYMAPEVLLGRVADPRADLFAIGCMLFEVVAGRPTWPSPTRREPIPVLEEFAPGLPRQLYALVSNLLAADPRERIGYADDVARCLAALGGAGVSFDGESSPPPRSYLYRAELSGRDHDMAAVCHQVLERRSRLSLLAGESGVGKTRLLLELIRKIRREGVDVVSCECSPDGIRQLEPIRTLLLWVHDQFQLMGPNATARMLGTRAKVLAAVEPALGQLPGVSSLPSPDPLPGKLAAERLIQAFVEALNAIALDRRIVLVVDDIQWADELTIAFLKHVSSQLAVVDAPVSVVAAYRAEEAGHDVAALVSSGTRPMVLGRLDSSAVATMVREMLAVTEAPGELSARLYASSEGNPFFVGEYLRAVVSGGLLSRGADGSWRVKSHSDRDVLPSNALPFPDSLRSLVELRLIGLSETALGLVSAAAILGRECETSILDAVADLSEADRYRAMNEVVARHVLEERAPEVFRFCHDKLREVAEDRIDERRAEALHGRAAAAYEAKVAAGGDERARDDLAPALARHYRLAGALAEAARHERIAGRANLRAWALTDAIKHYLRALEIVDALPRTAATDELRIDARLDLYVPIMQAHSAADDRLIRLSEEAADLASRIEDLGKRCRIHGMLAGTLLTRGEYRRSSKHCHLAMRQAKAAGTPLLAAYPAMVLAMVQIELGEVRRIPERLSPLIELIEDAGLSGDTLGAPYPPYVSLCGSAALACALTGRMEERDRLAASALRAGASSRHKYGHAYASLTVAWAHAPGSDGRACAHHGEQAMGLGIEAGLSGPRLLGSYSAGVGYAIQGRAREAIALLEEALELSSSLGYAAFRTEAYYGLAIARLADGDVSGSRQECQRGLALVSSRGERKLEGELLRLLGETYFDQRDVAERHLSRSLALCEAREMRVYAEMTRLSLGRLHAAHGSRRIGLGEIEVARDALARMGMIAKSEEAAAILATM